MIFESVVGNGDNPLAAFALDFEGSSAKFGHELAAFTSCFGRYEFFAQPPGVALHIHVLKRARQGSSANFFFYPLAKSTMIFVVGYVDCENVS